RPATDITVADMIQALEGPIALTACVDTGDDLCGLETLCPMHGHWNAVNRKVENALRAVTLAEMAEPLLGEPPEAAGGAWFKGAVPA
ncbi:MAG: RrF2 family transcriptional regulator, partial [Rhodospirillaceae bacterium]